MYVYIKLNQLLYHFFLSSGLLTTFLALNAVLTLEY